MSCHVNMELTMSCRSFLSELQTYNRCGLFTENFTMGRRKNQSTALVRINLKVLAKLAQFCDKLVVSCTLYFTGILLDTSALAV